jgi:hypothetical protein
MITSIRRSPDPGLHRSGDRCRALPSLRRSAPAVAGTGRRFPRVNGALITSWLLTVVFVATGGYSLVRTATRGTWATRVSHGTHVLMCAAMAVMPWAWATHLPPVPLIVVFAVTGGWHLAVGVLRPADLAGGQQRRHGRILGLAHAGMMFAMVWMTVLMAYVSGADPAGTTMAGMPGMAMPGGHGMSMPGGHGGQPWWAHGLTAFLAAGFLATACWFVVVRARRPRDAGEPDHRLPWGDGVAGGVMAVAMAASLATMW